MTEHYPECPVTKAGGSCCPWISGCECQCMCDFIAEILEAAVQRVDTLPFNPSVSLDPIDCNYSCDDGPCTCSGVRRVRAWSTSKEEVVTKIRGGSDGS